MQKTSLVDGDVYGNHGGWFNTKCPIGSQEHFNLWSDVIISMSMSPSQFLYGVWYSVCPMCHGHCKWESETEQHKTTTVCKFCNGYGTFKDYYTQQPKESARKLQTELIAVIELLHMIDINEQIERNLVNLPPEQPHHTAS